MAQWAMAGLMAAAAAATALAPGAALAAGADNAIAEAGDAFGTAVGKESSGIYTDKDTRGFNPIDAGNARIDGIYYDPVGTLSSRLKASTTIRVGFAAETFAFSAPTGVADYRFRPFPADTGLALAFRGEVGGEYLIESDLRLPLIGDRLGLTGGAVYGTSRRPSGLRNEGGSLILRPILRTGSIEFAPFVSSIWSFGEWTQPLAIVDGPWLAPHPPKRRFLNQSWTDSKRNARQYGATLKAGMGGPLRLVAGLFRAGERKIRPATELYVIRDEAGLSDHYLFADPEHDVHSTSGEARVEWRLGSGRWTHALIVGGRFRNRVTRAGGTAIVNFGQVRYGDLDPRDETPLQYAPVSRGRVRQTSAMLGYLANIKGLGRLNMGVQRARYRSTLVDGRTGARDAERAEAWLYNAVATLDLTPAFSVYAGTERGLEDNGAAPETATNRGQQLPAAITTQYEGGLRWRFHGGALVLSAFQITKPYFTYDLSRAYARLGDARLRGLEASATWHPDTRLALLAGAVLMRARVSGGGIDSGQIGARPAGKPAIRARLDASYRTDLAGGLEPTLALAYTGRRAVGSVPQPLLGGGQLMVPGFAQFDLGFRLPLPVKAVKTTLRVNLENAFDARAWKVAAPNTIYPEERRRLFVTVFADL